MCTSSKALLRLLPLLQLLLPPLFLFLLCLPSRLFLLSVRPFPFWPLSELVANIQRRRKSDSGIEAAFIEATLVMGVLCC